jgi:hypothetical protein
VGKGDVTIANSYATGKVFASGERASAGGLMGSGNVTITNSYAAGYVSSDVSSGGLVGKNSRGSKIENSYSLGSVKGAVIGGIVGENSGAIINCYHLAGNADMLVGKNEGGTITMTSGARTEEQMKQKDTYKGWNFADVWEISSRENDGFPYLYYAGNFAKTKHGKYEWHYENGKLRLVCNYKDGKLNGKYTWYYENGKISEAGNFKNGERDGKLEFYYENGKPKEVSNFKDGKLNGRSAGYYENGKIGATGNYKDDKLDGKWELYYDNGKLSEVRNYKDGEIVYQ